MHTLVVERVVGLAEELLIRLTPVERRVVLAGHETNVLTLSSLTMSRNSASRFRRSLGSSVVCVRSPVKKMKSGCCSRLFTAATAFLRVPLASGFGGPSKPQWQSDIWTKKNSSYPLARSRCLLRGLCPATEVEANTTPPSPASFKKVPSVYVSGHRAILSWF